MLNKLEKFLLPREMWMSEVKIRHDLRRQTEFISFFPEFFVILNCSSQFSFFLFSFSEDVYTSYDKLLFSSLIFFIYHLILRRNSAWSIQYHLQRWQICSKLVELFAFLTRIKTSILSLAWRFGKRRQLMLVLGFDGHRSVLTLSMCSRMNSMRHWTINRLNSYLLTLRK